MAESWGSERMGGGGPQPSPLPGWGQQDEFSPGTKPAVCAQEMLGAASPGLSAQVLVQGLPRVAAG